MGRIADMIAIAQKVHQSNEGYDQSQRWTWLDKKNFRIVPNKECDCSSLCGGIIYLAGYKIDLNGTFYTGNFAAKASAAGFSVIKFKKFSQVKPGDFLLRTGHVELVTGSNEMFSAHIDERGKASGGKAGNQTGRETGYGKLSGSWTYILRPPADPVAKKPAKSKNEIIAEEVIAGKWGNGEARKLKLKKAGYDYVKIQAIVNRLTK